MKLFNSLENYLGRVRSHVPSLPEKRKKVLDDIRKYVDTHPDRANLIFICTHNSRRSQFGQIWAQIAAGYYGFMQVKTYSGGTEATAFHPNALAALERAGFMVKKVAEEKNPLYEISIGEGQEVIKAFSKAYDHPANPSGNFLALMTCSEADENCPFVIGAEQRISLHYEDPKIADGTVKQDEIYDERCLQIAAEMFYVFS